MQNKYLKCLFKWCHNSCDICDITTQKIRFGISVKITTLLQYISFFEMGLSILWKGLNSFPEAQCMSVPKDGQVGIESGQRINGLLTIWTEIELFGKGA